MSVAVVAGFVTLVILGIILICFFLVRDLITRNTESEAVGGPHPAYREITKYAPRLVFEYLYNAGFKQEEIFDRMFGVNLFLREVVGRAPNPWEKFEKPLLDVLVDNSVDPKRVQEGFVFLFFCIKWIRYDETSSAYFFSENFAHAITELKKQDLRFVEHSVLRSMELETANSN